MHSVCILCLQSRDILKTQNKAPGGVLLPAVVKYFTREKWKIYIYFAGAENFCDALSRFYDESARTLAVVNDIAEQILHAILRAANKIEETLRASDLVIGSR
jgi:hypothetical protein